MKTLLIFLVWTAIAFALGYWQGHYRGFLDGLSARRKRKEKPGLTRTCSGDSWYL